MAASTMGLAGLLTGLTIGLVRNLRTRSSH
jgi:hypothetical protein